MTPKVALMLQVLMCLPSSVPMPVDNSPIWLAIVVVSSLAAWYLPRVGVRKYYVDPRTQASSATFGVTALVHADTI